MPKPRLAVIGVPSSAGARRRGQEGAPAALRAAGLLEGLRAEDLDVVDFGDLPTVSFSPDSRHPKQQNLALVVEVARRVTDRVDQALASHRLPLVVGGDCSLSLGVIAGVLRTRPRSSLLYFDGDLDLNTPETTQSGIFDGMVMAHILGWGAPPLAGIGTRRPLLSEADVALFGYDVESGSTDPPELEFLERSRMAKYPLVRIQGGPAEAAREALRHLESRSDAVLVHFDVDVMNFPAADVFHPNGLDAESAYAALRIFATAPTCSAIAVTEFNPERDPDGTHAERLVRGLVWALSRGQM